MRVVVLGGGRIGSRLAKLLRNDKHDVVVIEIKKEEAERVSKDLDVLVLQGDGTSRRLLLDADIKNCGLFIAATGDDKVNILACEIAKRYGVQKTLSRVTDPENYEIFLDLDIAPINESLIITEALRRAVYTSNRHNIIAYIADGGAEVTRYVVKETSVVVGKKVNDLGLERNFIYIDRAGEMVSLSEKTEIALGDIIYYVALRGEGERIKGILEDRQ